MNYIYSQNNKYFKLSDKYGLEIPIGQKQKYLRKVLNKNKILLSLQISRNNKDLSIY